MKAIYDIEVTGEGCGPSVTEHASLDAIEVDGVQIELRWDAESREITRVKLTIPGVKLRRDPITKSILPTYPELEVRAFAAASFVANILRIETGHDGVDPFAVIGETPTLHAENPEEEQALASEPRPIRKNVGIRFDAKKLLAASEWQHWGQFAADKRVRKALTGYAHGMRVQSPFLRFEQFYKVVEHFFPKKEGTELDRAVSRHCATFDPSLEESVMCRLRELRNGSIHSEPRRVEHLSPQDLNDFRKITAGLKQLQDVVRLLLLHPPT